MKRDLTKNLIAAALIALNPMLCPISFADAARAALFALLFSLPGLLLGRKNAVHTNLFAFGDAMYVALPAALLIDPYTPGIGVFAAAHMLLYRLLGGRLLKKSGLSREKNFTLILAYRQTLKHRHRFPNEVHPHANPLFDAARRAQTALLQLLPLLGLPIGMMLNASAAPAGIAIRILSAVLLLLSLTTRPFLPKQPPTRLALTTIFCHLPMVCLPPNIDFASDSGLFDDVYDAYCWCRLTFILLLPIAILMK